MKHSKIRHSLLAVAVAALILPAQFALAQNNPEEQREERSDRPDPRSRVPSDRANARAAARAAKKSSQPTEARVQQYPEATRPAPTAKASSKLSPKLQKLMVLLDEQKPAEVRALADEILANSAANEYERSFAAQIAGQAANDASDPAAAMGYFSRAIEANGLDNNSHYSVMLALAQMQLQEDKFAESVATFDRFFAETKSQKPEHLVLKGNALYRMERFGDAAAVLKQAIDASPDPKAEWMQLLMGAYLENNQSAEAAKVAEAVAAKSPNDKRAQMNLAVVYAQNDMFDKAAAVLEQMRTAGQLTEDKDYRQLYSVYLNLEGREKEAATVINEGLQKGILKPDYQAYLAMAQSYYFSDQHGPAIDAYKKAAPLAPDGETYLNLARALWQQDRIAEAKEAAKQAIAKGIKKPDDAKKILALK